MNLITRRRCCLVAGMTLLILSAAAGAAPATQPAARDSSLRVMSFNLRIPVIFDFANHWDFRKAIVVRTVRQFNPDLLGVQECFVSQAKYLRSQLTDYEFFGAGRDDGKLGGEMAGVFFKPDRFEKVAGGHFWLSPTPEKVGSRGWGAPFPRIVTYVRLRPRDGSPEFYWFNTHFEAFSSNARTASATLLRSRITAIAGIAPVVVTGDFNCDDSSLPYQILVKAPGACKLFDSYRTLYPRVSDDERTLHGFSGSTSGSRIDWILTTSAFQAVNADIDRRNYAGRWPSDHFPVTAILKPLGPMTAQRTAPAPLPSRPVIRGRAG